MLINVALTRTSGSICVASVHAAGAAAALYIFLRQGASAKCHCAWAPIFIAIAFRRVMVGIELG